MRTTKAERWEVEILLHGCADGEHEELVDRLADAVGALIEYGIVDERETERTLRTGFRGEIDDVVVEERKLGLIVLSVSPRGHGLLDDYFADEPCPH